MKIIRFSNKAILLENVKVISIQEDSIYFDDVEIQCKSEKEAKEIFESVIGWLEGENKK